MIAIFDNVGESILEKISTAVSGVMEDFKSVGAGIGVAISEGIERGIKGRGIIINASDIITVDTDEMMANLEKRAQHLRAQIAMMSQDAEQKFTGQAQAMQAVLSTFADNISKAFEGGTTSVAQFASQVLVILGDMLIQAGTFAIKMSNLMSVAAIPGIGVAAGIAAIAVGAMLKGIASKMQSEGAQPMAMGGLVMGPTRALIGEYPGARSNPEVVAPLDKLKSLIGGSSSGNMMVGEFTLRGQDLVVALQRADRNRNRFK
jgi:hypothetical protein